MMPGSACLARGRGKGMPWLGDAGGRGGDVGDQDQDGDLGDQGRPGVSWDCDQAGPGDRDDGVRVMGSQGPTNGQGQTWSASSAIRVHL